MSYVFQHIFGCLFVAALLGGLVGWLLRHFAAASRIQDLLGEWTGKVDLAHGERDRLALQLKDSEGAVSGWRSKLANLEGEHGSLKASLDSASSKIPVLETAVAGWVAKSALWDKSKSQMEADLKACADARSALQVQIGDLNTRIATADKRAVAAEAGLKDWQGKYSTLEASHTQFKASADTTASKIPALEAVVAGWVAKSALWDKGKSQLEADLKAAGAARATLEAQVADLTRKHAALDKDWQARYAKLEGDLKAAADGRAGLEGQVADLTRKLAGLDADRAKLKADMRKATDDDTIEDARYEKVIASLRGDLAAMEKRAAAAEAIHKDWQGRYSALETLHGQLKATAETSSSRIPVLETAIAGWVAKSALWDKSKAQYDTEVKVSSDARSSLETQVREWIEKAKAWDRDRAAFESQIANLRGEIKSATEEDVREDAKYERTINGLRADVTALQGKLDSTAQDRDRLSLELKRAIEADQKDDAEFKKIIEKLRAELAANEGRLKTVEAGAKDWQAKYGTLETQFKSAAQERDGLSAKLKAAISADEKDDAEFRKTIEKLRADLTATEVRLKDAEAGARNWQAKYGEYEGQVKNLQGRLTALEAERNGLSAKATQLEAQWSTRYVALEAQLAEVKPLAMAAAAAAGSAPAAPAPDTGMKRRFEAFVIKTQKEGYGDIERIEGIGPVYGQKLRGIGIAWVKDLLQEGGGPTGREEIAEQTGIDRRLILKWVNAADLLRIQGMTPDWAELLEESGVDTVKELRNRVAENLQAKMVDTNAGGNFAREVPGVDVVRGWIEQAKKLDPKVTH